MIWAASLDAVVVHVPPANRAYRPSALVVNSTSGSIVPHAAASPA